MYTGLLWNHDGYILKNFGLLIFFFEMLRGWLLSDDDGDGEEVVW